MMHAFDTAAADFASALARRFLFKKLTSTPFPSVSAKRATRAVAAESTEPLIDAFTGAAPADKTLQAFVVLPSQGNLPPHDSGAFWAAMSSQRFGVPPFMHCVGL